MTETIDQLIQARFDAVANPLDDRDWGDVLTRRRHRARRRQAGAGPSRARLPPLLRSPRA